MAQKIVIGIIVVVVVAAGFLFISQQREVSEGESPAVQLPESKTQKLLNSLGTSPNQRDLTQAEKEDLLKSLGENPNKRDLSEEEKQEFLESLGTISTEK